MLGILYSNCRPLIPSGNRAAASLVFRRLQQFIDKLLIVFGIKPCCTDLHINIAGFQRFRHCLFQRRYIYIEIRIVFRSFFRFQQLFPDISRQVFACRQISVFCMRNFENLAGEIMFQFIFCHSRQAAHIVKIHSCLFCYRKRKSFQRGFNVFNCFRRNDGTLEEDIGFFFQFCFVIVLFQACNKVIRNILREIPFVCLGVDQPVFLVEIIIDRIQLFL